MNAVATIEQKPAEVTRFELMQREAKMFSMSPLVPSHLRPQGRPEEALANCYIALHMAKAMEENPIVTMQNIYIVSGKAGWASKYMIARANASGVFKGGINWRIEGKGDALKVTAFAILSNTGQEVSAEVSMEMAKKEGWTKNAKYQTMPEVMLRYRSASFLVNFYCPQVMLGYQTAEELEDMAAAPLAEPAKALSATAILEQAEDGIVDVVAEEIVAEEKPTTDLFGEPVVEQQAEEVDGIKPLSAQPTNKEIIAWSHDVRAVLDACITVKDVTQLRQSVNQDLLRIRAEYQSTYDKICKGFIEVTEKIEAAA